MVLVHLNSDEHRPDEQCQHHNSHSSVNRRLPKTFTIWLSRWEMLVLLSWECRSPLSTTNSAASIRFARHKWTTFHRLEHNKVSDGQSSSPEKPNQPSTKTKDKLTVFASIDDLRTIESPNGRRSTNLNSHFVNGTKLNHKDENIIRTFTVDTADLLSALALNWHRSSLSTISLLSPDIARWAIVAVPSPLHSVCQLSSSHSVISKAISLWLSTNIRMSSSMFCTRFLTNTNSNHRGKTFFITRPNWKKQRFLHYLYSHHQWEQFACSIGCTRH